jgi:UDP-N-acetylglucosamine--N-acetylmuramyl-(pentapeptide) pyrophosphoryl-undecaprenol N-acetylglucosamine transferase
VYPALVVLQQWLNETNSGGPDNMRWIGSEGGMEASLVAQAGIPFVALPAGGLRGGGSIRTVRNALRIASGVGRAWQLMASFRPDVAFVTGGYACVAATLAAWLRRVPVLIYLPDVVPGLAIKVLSRLAARVAVTCAEAVPYIPGSKAIVTGYPVRPELFALSRSEARSMLGLPQDEKVLLVFGGSRGARSLNQAVLRSLPELLELAHLVHVSGRLDAEAVRRARARLPQLRQARYHAFGYLHDEMPLALLAADLAVARAGASTMGEFPAAGLPSILVPYPYSGQHQLPNAEYMATRGAARIVLDSDLDTQLLPLVTSLLTNPGALASMARAAKALARPDAADNLVAELRALSNQPGLG